MSTPKQFNIYKITNRLTGKSYIGVTTYTVKYRWESHVRTTRKTARKSKTAITEAIIKYGPEAFEVAHLASSKSVDDMLEVERALISQENTLAPNGYNLTDGGEKSKAITDDVRRKLSIAATGVKHSTEALARRSASLKKHWQIRKRKSQEEYSAIVRKAWEARRVNGNDTHEVSMETREKISKGRRGIRHKPETIAVLAEKSRLYFAANGSRWTGRKHTDETKAKFVAAWARRKAKAQDGQLGLL